MADVTGAVTVQHAGKTYALRLTFGAMAELQDEFGQDIAGLLTGTTTPNFKAMGRMVELALKKGTPAAADQAGMIADEIATVSLVQSLISAAFPEGGQSSGNAKRPKAAA